MSTDWSLDFCMVCDRQTLGGAYCSQACRLAEIDQYSSDSEASSPTAATHPNHLWPTHSTKNHEAQSSRHFGDALALLTSKTPRVQTAFSSLSSLFSKPSRGTTLTPSSSHTSLSSLSSSSSSIVSVSGRAKTELEEYAGCFDQVRDWKRRLTLS